jgi:hypothetical protein
MDNDDRFEADVRELRELIAMLEARHRDGMRPYYEHLVRYESMRLRPHIIEMTAEIAEQIKKL